jgi:transmembrane E3 ubiquitin-protein ligase
MEIQRAVLIVFLIFFFLFSPETTQPSRSQRKRLNGRISKEHQALELLRNSSYGDGPPKYHQAQNETGRGDEDRVSWHLLPEFQNRARAQYLEVFADSQKLSIHDVAGSEQAYELAAETSLPFYQNVSGTIQIKAPINLTTPVAENKYAVHDFWRNVTETEVGLTLQIFEKAEDAGADDAAREISADAAVQTDSSPGSGWEMKLFGVHYPKTGSIMLTTTSEKFPGIFTLPHFALTRAGFEQSKELLNHSLSETVSHQEQGRSDGFVSPWSSGSDAASATLFSVPTCEYVVYLQQQPVRFTDFRMDSKQLLQLVRRVEQELQFPEGAPIPSVPPMTFSAVVYSPDCGFVLESGRDRDRIESRFLSGPKTEVFWILIRQLLLALMIVLGLQISLLKRQMDEASTPSMRSRTSYHSIAIMGMGDGLMLASLIAFSMVNDAGFLILTSAGFLCFFNFAFFEMKFIYDIWLVQVGDQRREDIGRRDQREDAEVQNGTTTQLSRYERPQPSNQAAADPSGLPLPVTAPRLNDTGATPISLPSDQDIETMAEENEQQNAAATGSSPAARTSLDFQTLYSRFYFSMLVLVFFSLWAFSWPKTLRSAYANLLCFAYLSFWIPQIYRNVMRNCRQAFTWEYVIGISILRLVPIFYCYIKKSNILRTDTDPFAAAVFAGWVSVQILALATQEFLGPRLFVKESWCPPAYDYHPLLQNGVGDVESGSLLPIGFVASASEAKDKDNTKHKDSSRNLKIFDCAICMNEIEVPVVPSRETVDRSGLGASWLGRRAYMVTPCRHIFHSECLEGWMRLRLVCPICRESLPPL